MPIREYQALDREKSCNYCRERFERMEAPEQEPLKSCPKCGAALKQLISAPNIGSSKTGLDNRAKHAGFHKLKKISHGEYEKQY
mgnify:CR=1 FL=1